jgi:hypothetical protein
MDWLRKHVIHPDPNIFAHNRGVYILPESGNILASKIAIVAGEFASCHRNALNYLTCAVAQQDSGAVSNSVQFPLESAPKTFIENRSRYLRSISDEHLAFFERHQPYNTGKPFELLREFSNAYRHRALLRVEKNFQDPKIPTPPPETFRIAGGHIVHMNWFEIAVSLTDGSPIVETLEEIERRVFAKQSSSSESRSKSTFNSMVSSFFESDASLSHSVVISRSCLSVNILIIPFARGAISLPWPGRRIETKPLAVEFWLMGLSVGLHTEDAEGGWGRGAGVEGSRNAEGERGTGVQRIDDAVVP